ncbi:MAG: sodium-dependent transporter [Termitinemataceae bacterium]
MEQKRETWGSRIGFLLAAAGSAIGLGNIWRFPYMAGANGGSAFILIYIIMAFSIGLSVMIAEFAVGRRTGRAAVGAFKSISSRWTFAGVLGVLSGFLIMGFYPVVGGWSLAYIFKSMTGLLATPETIPDSFSSFISNPWEPLLWMLFYMILNISIVIQGITGGIEKASKILMPALLVMLLVLAGRSLTLPNAEQGLLYLFKPDFSKVTGATVLAALGQAFFSLSLGMGCMITYGSYLTKDQKLLNNAVFVTAMDTGIAILAGIAIFPALFSFGMEPAAGPGLVFIVVPSVFAKMGVLGILLSAIFFGALMVAALTSSVSLLEVVTAYLIDEKNIPRTKAVIGSSMIMVIMCVLSSLSLGIMSNIPIPLLNVGFFRRASSRRAHTVHLPMNCSVCARR